MDDWVSGWETLRLLFVFCYSIFILSLVDKPILNGVAENPQSDSAFTYFAISSSVSGMH